MASNLKVIIDNAQIKLKIPSGTRMLVRRSCHAALQQEGYDKQAVISVTFADNEMLGSFDGMRVSNFEAPELIAIPENNGEENLGRIILSVERVLELTRVYNRPFEMGIVFASIHGVLNLLGQFYLDQETKDAQMKKEALVMSQMGYSPLSDFETGKRR